MDELRDIPCGIDGLDDILGGFKTPSTILIAGTAGVGKTMMALQMLSNAAKQGEKTLYIPLTTESPEKLKMFLSTFEFFDESVQIHEINRPVAEKDPLTTLIDMGNVIASVNLSREDVGYRAKHYLQVLKMRGVNPKIKSRYISRKYRCGMTSKGITVYPNLRPVKDIILSDNKIKSGTSGLDKMLNGGMMESSSMLVAGGPGTGKTIFGLQFINRGLLDNEPCIIATFEERPEQLVLEAKKVGFDLAPYIDSGLLKFIYSDPDNVCPAEHAIHMKKYVESMGAKRVFFDGIVNLEMALPDHLQLRGYLHTLTDYLKSSSVTSVFTTEISSNCKDLITSPDASFIMDSVVILKHVEYENKLRRYTYILKSRGTKHDRGIREYSITDDGILIKEGVLSEVK
jgi:circadian clock protein KaiC